MAILSCLLDPTTNFEIIVHPNFSELYDKLEQVFQVRFVYLEFVFFRQKLFYRLKNS